VRAGLPTPGAQVLLMTPDGPRRADLAVDLPDGRLLVLEVDGIHHADPRVRLQDAAKDAAIVAQGHQVLRIPVLSVRSGEATIVTQLTAIRRAAEQRTQHWA
jgi:very-short-patch-repair endonuclease